MYIYIYIYGGLWEPMEPPPLCLHPPSLSAERGARDNRQGRAQWAQADSLAWAPVARAVHVVGGSDREGDAQVPTDVDYRIMVTFLEFACCQVRTHASYRKGRGRGWQSFTVQMAFCGS